MEPLPTRDEPPLISVVVAMYDMRRAAARTLFSLAPGYQRGVAAGDYEVLVVDNGSTEPLDPAGVAGHGAGFHYRYHETDSVSPAAAVNAAVRATTGTHVMICIDGARILSPGILALTRSALLAFDDPVVATLGWHLGHEAQQVAVAKGYDEAAEDELLATVDWQADGYRLFDVAALAGSSRDGWFLPIAESNCMTVSRSLFEEVGGLDERFHSRGGGLVNLDFFRRTFGRPGATPVVLLGEGTFHQVHGGISTNVPQSASPWDEFHAEYRAIVGSAYRKPEQDPVFLGRMPDAARRFLRAREPAG